MAARRVEVVDQLVVAMCARDVDAVKAVLLGCQPSRDEIRAASDLRRLALWLDARPIASTRHAGAERQG